MAAIPEKCVIPKAVADKARIFYLHSTVAITAGYPRCHQFTKESSGAETDGNDTSKRRLKTFPIPERLNRSNIYISIKFMLVNCKFRLRPEMKLRRRDPDNNSLIKSGGTQQ